MKSGSPSLYYSEISRETDPVGYTKISTKEDIGTDSHSSETDKFHKLCLKAGDTGELVV